jgi:HEAT repeat protein
LSARAPEGILCHEGLSNLDAEERAVRKLVGLLVLFVFASTSAANVDELIKKLASKDSEGRRAAAKDLGDLGKDAKPAVKALTRALGDGDTYVVQFSAEALGKIGPDAKDAIPALTKLLGNGKSSIREAAIKAIGKMGEAAVPALSKAVSGTTSDVQENAIAALTEAGPTALPALSAAIRDSKMDAALRRKAVAAVLSFDSEQAKKALPSLAAAVRDGKVRGRDGQQLRIDSIKALGRLASTEDKPAISALESLSKNPKLRDNNPLKRAATQALKQIRGRKSDS